MTADLPKLTSGRVGPIRFDHMNRVLDATSKVEDMTGGIRGTRKPRFRSFFAELIAEVATVGTRSAWSWEQVGVNAAGNAIGLETGQLESGNYDTAQDGYAISLDGSGGAGDVVLIHEMPGYDGKRWFAFGSGSGGSVFALQVDSVTGSEAPFTYSVIEGKIDGTGAFAATGEVGTMYNLYEFDPYGHGQSLSFTSGTLTIEALAGTVFGGLSMIDGSVRVYICDVPNPMTPVCGSTSDSPGGLTAEQVMRYGI